MTTGLYETKFDRVLRDQGRKRDWIAQRLSVSHSTVFRWCNGERVIPPGRVRELAALLGVHEEDILEDSPRPQRVGVA